MLMLPTFLIPPNYVLAIFGQKISRNGKANSRLPSWCSISYQLTSFLSFLIKICYSLNVYLQDKKKFFLRFCVSIFRERGGKEKEREINISWLPLVGPQLGTWPATQACVRIKLVTFPFIDLHSIY